MLNFLQNLSPELITASLSALPFIELRGAIPLGLGVYKLPVVTTFFLAVLGNLIPALFLLLGLESISGHLSKRVGLFQRFFSWLLARTQKNYAKNFARWKELALVILIAIPLPLTGAWTGSLCAFVCGIPFKRAFPLISLGVALAGIIVTLISIGIINLL